MKLLLLAMLLWPACTLAQLEAYDTEQGTGLRTAKGKVLLKPSRRLVQQLNDDYWVITEGSNDVPATVKMVDALNAVDLDRTMNPDLPGSLAPLEDDVYGNYYYLYSRTGKRWPRPLGYVSLMPDSRVLLQDSTGMSLIDGTMKVLYKADALYPLGWPATYGYAVYKNGKCGLIDKSLKETLPIAYTGISTYISHRAMEEEDSWTDDVYYNIEGGEVEQSSASGYRMDNTDLQTGQHLLLYSDNQQGLADAHALVLLMEAKAHDIAYLDSAQTTLVVTETQGDPDWGNNGEFRLYSAADMNPVLQQRLIDIKLLLQDYYLVQVPGGKYGIVRRSNMEWVQQPDMDEIVGGDGYIILKKDNKRALATEDLEVLLGYEYDYIYAFTLNGREEYPMVTLTNGKKTGLYDPNKAEWVLPAIYKYIGNENYGRSSLIRVVLPDGQKGLFDFDKKQFLLKPEWIDISYNGNDKYLAVSERQMLELNIRTGELVKRKSVSDQFAYKWKAPVGYLTYRGSMAHAAGRVAIGTVSGYRYEEHTSDETDGLQGLRVLDGRTGELVYRLDTLDGDALQLNGVALNGNRVYWASETDRAGCTDLGTRTQLWTAPMGGEPESSPALADLNGDGAIDVVVALQSRGFVALNGLNGDTLWTAFMDEMAIEACMASPALADLNGDGVADVVGPASGLRDVPSWQNNSYEGSVWAMDGRTGRKLWQVTMTNYAQAKAAPIVQRTGATTSIYQPCLSGSLMHISAQGATQLLAVPSGTCGSWLPVGTELYGGMSYYEEEHHVLAISTLGATPYTDEYGRPGLKTKPRQLAPGRMPATPLLADVLATGTPQLIMATEEGYLHLLTTQGQLLHTLALPAGTEATPLVADVDQDGLLELLIAGKDGYLYCYDTNSRGQVVWGQHRGDNQNTGCMK